MNIPIPPGVFDILPDDNKEKWRSSYLWEYLESVIREIVLCYGYREIRTPIFERTELFIRSVGETTDIVTKEMYTFNDKGNRSMTLRPEGTASVMRSLVENKLLVQSPIQKLFYIGPMFRYERQQAGRYRQHHQFGVEAVGIADPEQDAEVIDLLYTLYNKLGLKNLTVHLNSIGDLHSRTAFRSALVEYFTEHVQDLSPDSRNRFKTNPLRILDSKDPQDQKINAQAPSILDYLNSDCKEHFQQVQGYLDLLEIPYRINPLLVRGLDYYNKTVFEITSGDLGAQNTVGGGGRYDGLLKMLGGPDLPAIGFGSGIERILQTMIKQNTAMPKPKGPEFYLIPLGTKASKCCFELVHRLREQGIHAQMDLSKKKLQKTMQHANDIGAQYVAVIGDEEMQEGRVVLKTMATGEKKTIALDDLKTVHSRS